MRTRIKTDWRWSLLPLLGVLSGCSGGDAGTAPESSTSAAQALDQAVLDNALLNEGQFAASGYELEGRAWVAPDVGLSFYVDHDGERVVSLLMRGGAETDPAAVTPENGETFAAFVARRGHGSERTVEGVGSSAPNVLLFDPSSTAAPARTLRPETIGRNDFCPRSWFDSQCQLWTGYADRSFPLGWYVTDEQAPITEAQSNLTGAYAVACADVGTVDFTLKITNPRWGTVAGSVAVTLNQGMAQRNSVMGGWQQVEYCKTHVLGICVDHAYRAEYQTFTASASITPHSNSEAHFCGTMTANEDYYVGDTSCDVILTCPFACPPGSTNAACQL